MKTYTLKGKGKQPDVRFTVNDLIAIKQKRKYSFNQLASFINYSQFHPSEEDFEKDRERLYKRKQNAGADFFQIKNTDIVVIPGGLVFPTLLKKSEVETGNT